MCEVFTYNYDNPIFKILPCNPILELKPPIPWIDCHLIIWGVLPLLVSMVLYSGFIVNDILHDNKCDSILLLELLLLSPFFYKNIECSP